MNRKIALNIAIDELVKKRRQFAPEAHIYEKLSTPALRRHKYRYDELSMVIEVLEKIREETQ